MPWANHLNPSCVDKFLAGLSEPIVIASASLRLPSSETTTLAGKVHKITFQSTMSSFPYHRLSRTHLTERALRDFDRLQAEVYRPQTPQTYGETKTVVSLLPLLLGEDDNFASENDQAFTNLTPLVEELAACKPDLYDGLCPSEVDPRVRKDLNGLIVPSRQGMAPIAPNFFLELKGQDGSFAVAGRQAWHDGIVGARSMHAIHCYGRDTTLDNNSYTLSASFYDTTIKIYSTHPILRKGRIGYSTVQVFGCLMDDAVNFHLGVSALRNARTWAENKRMSLVSAANDRCKTSTSEISTIPVKRHQKSSTVFPTKRQKGLPSNTSISADQTSTGEQAAYSSTLSAGEQVSQC